MAHNAPIQSVTRNRNEGHLQEYAEQSRKAERFNDVCIMAGNNSFPAHRLVLACYSKFFERLFQTPMKEQYKGIVNLDELDGEAVRLLLEYMYVGSITISQNNVFNLLVTANFLQIDEVCQYCFDFLKIIISIKNWFTILSTLHLYENNSVLKQLYQSISENFNNIAKSEHFKELEIQDLTSIVLNLNRKILKETSIYDAITSWIRHDELNRKNKAGYLLTLIDLHQLPSDFLEDVVATDPLVKENVDCLNAVTSAITKQFKEMRLREKESNLISVGGCADPRLLLQIHGIFGSLNAVYSNPPNISYFSKAVTLNSYIYSIGGSLEFGSKELTNKVYRMNVNDSKMKWEEVCPLSEGRCAMGAAVFKNCLVVAGGVKTDDEFSRKEETFIPALNKWQQISKLNQKRASNQLVSCDSCLFAFGGNDMKQTLSSMEKLSDLDGEWQVVEAMNESRAWFAAVNCQGEIYAIGGLKIILADGILIALKSVEKYNPVKMKWTFVRSMSTERAGHAAYVLRGKIFVVGGWDDDEKPVETIECYDPASDKWDVFGETEENEALQYHSLADT